MSRDLQGERERVVQKAEDRQSIGTNSSSEGTVRECKGPEVGLCQERLGKEASGRKAGGRRGLQPWSCADKSKGVRVNAIAEGTSVERPEAQGLSSGARQRVDVGTGAGASQRAGQELSKS